MRPADPPAPTLALVAAVALEEVAVAYLGPERVLIKWPNDILVRSSRAKSRDVTQRVSTSLDTNGEVIKKVAGILLERSGDAVVIGFGVNLAHHPDLPDRPAISFAALGVDAPAPDLFLRDLADSFARWLGRWRGEGLSPVRQRWLDRAHAVGTPLSSQGVEGLFEGLDESGALRLRLADGSLHVMHAGDVFIL